MGMSVVHVVYPYMNVLYIHVLASHCIKKKKKTACIHVVSWRARLRAGTNKVARVHRYMYILRRISLDLLLHTHM